MKDKAKKSPVLTSPGKIGALVALLLVLVGFGGSYYVIELYNIELEWLQGSFGQWKVDSYAFFKEMYPLVAGTLLLSVISYMVVASAVRRYRYYLDSGQDYRKMIQLAGSIDDLTNPAQIAKLKRYPELQSILRNYGDQIGSISKQLAEQQSQTDQRSVDLEMEIDALLQGEGAQDSLVEDRWWTPLYRKIESRLQENQQALNGLKMKVHSGKTALGMIALSTGRIIEQIGGSSEDYPEIMNAVNDLNKFAKECSGDGGSKKKAPEPDRTMLKTIVTEMENSLHKLADGGKVLNEFSEENNGLALNIALIAAKGEVDEHDLAQFAEKVRSTADRFNKLSRTFTSMAQDLLGTCDTLKKKLGAAGETPNAAHHDEVWQAVGEVSAMIEQRCSQFQERLCCIGNEVHEVQELVNKSIKSITEEGGADEAGAGGKVSTAAGTGEEVGAFTEAASAEEEESDLVIDHGRVWDDGSGFGDDLVSFGKEEQGGSEKEQEEDAASADDASPVDEPEAEMMEEPEERVETEEPATAEETGGIDTPDDSDVAEGMAHEEAPMAEAAPEEMAQEPEDEGGEKEYVIPIDEEAVAEAEACLDGKMSPVTGVEETAEPGVQADAEEGAGAEEWFKIDIDKGERASEDTGPEEVSVRETMDVTHDHPQGQEAPPAEAEMSVEIPGLDSAAEDESAEEEPIYDLYELGAVDYVDEPVAKQ